MDGNIKSRLEFWIKRLEVNDFAVRNIASQLDPKLLAGTTARRSHVLFDDKFIRIYLIETENIRRELFISLLDNRGVCN
ncbi:MAG: hypothetical protein QXU18_10415 [Thermoplasmatales archaeon]